MPNNDTVGRKIVEALKKQAENMDVQEDDNKLFETSVLPESQPLTQSAEFEQKSQNVFFEDSSAKNASKDFFDDIEEEPDQFFAGSESVATVAQNLDTMSETFEMPANIAVLKKLISQLPSGVSRHTGAQIIKQTMEALGISMKSVLQDAQQVQENLKISARDCQNTIQDYKKQILSLEKQSQNYQRQYSALNDLISLFIQTTR